MTPITAVAEVAATVSCPLCHTPAPGLAAESPAGGTDWRCEHCHQTWSASRLSAVAASKEFCARRGEAS
jgi:transposase-like protein